MSNTIPVTRRTDPLVPITDSRFAYIRGADVQATWRRYGWVPPTEQRQQNPDQNQEALQTSQL